MAHTPTPWRVEENTDLIWGACNADDTSSYGMGYPIVAGFASFGTWAAGRPDFNEKEANAEFIVRAVNAHDELIEALNECAEYFERFSDADYDQDGFVPNKEMEMLSMIKRAMGET